MHHSIASIPSPIMTVSNEEHPENVEIPIDVAVSLISTEINIGHHLKKRNGYSLIPDPIRTCLVELLYVSANSLECDTVSVPDDETNTSNLCVKSKTIKNRINPMLH